MCGKTNKGSECDGVVASGKQPTEDSANFIDAFDGGQDVFGPSGLAHGADGHLEFRGECELRF